MPFISPRSHGLVDYLACVGFAAAPLLPGIDEPAAAIACHVAAASLLVLSLLTHYPRGAARLVPFRAHGALELLGAVALLVFPALAGLADEPVTRAFFLTSGALLCALWALTDYRAEPDRAPADGSLPCAASRS